MNQTTHAQVELNNGILLNERRGIYRNIFIKTK